MDTKKSNEIKKEIKAKQLKKVTPNDDEKKTFEELMALAKMPVKLKDKDIEYGDQELVIEGLSDEKKAQMYFRQLVINSVYQKELLSALIDIERILMVLGKHLGVEDMEKETSDLLEELQDKVLKRVANKKQA